MSETQSGSDDVRANPADLRGEAIRAAGGAWRVLDDVSAQNDRGTIRPAWPQPWARIAGVEHKTDVTPVVHTASGALVCLPPGMTWEEFVGAVQLE